MEKKTASKLTSVDNAVVTEIYPGVVHTFANTTPESSEIFGYANINVLEVDLSDPKLHFDVVGGGDDSNILATVAKTCADYTASGKGRTALGAINGDLWMVNYAHARYDMSIVAKGYEADGPVCKKSMTLPRGFNMYDGEIITTAHMLTELPFEGPFSAFGMTTDGEFVMGEPAACVSICCGKTGEKITDIDGINRLPVNNALVLYTHHALSENDYSLDEAYEILVETDGDYKICHGASITGTVKAIYSADTIENAAKLADNEYMLSARGSRIADISEIKAGNKVTLNVEITAPEDIEKWQKTRAVVGGHIQFVKNGEFVEGQWAGGDYPSTFIGDTNDGRLIFITYDGRQKEFSIAPDVPKLKQLVNDLNIKNAFYVDGGGSATMVVRDTVTGEYKVANRPCDKWQDGTFGSPRRVVNSVIVSCDTEAIK